MSANDHVRVRSFSWSTWALSQGLKKAPRLAFCLLVEKFLLFQVLTYFEVMAGGKFNLGKLLVRLHPETAMRLIYFFIPVSDFCSGIPAGWQWFLLLNVVL